MISFKSGEEFKSLQMKNVLSREDKAVSPIIATVLLIAITVTMIATAYTLLENYIPNPVPQTPSAAIKVVYDSHVAGTVYAGNYTIFINSLNGNLSVNDVNLIVTLSNNTVLELSLNQAYAAGAVYSLTNYLNISLLSSSGYLTSTSMISLHLHNSNSYITRIALVDTGTDGAIGSSLIS